MKQTADLSAKRGESEEIMSMEMEKDLQFRLARVAGIILKIARFAEIKCENREFEAIDVGLGGYALSRHLKDGVKDIMELETLLNNVKSSLKYAKEACEEQQKLINALFDEGLQAYEIMELLNDDEKKAIKEIYLKALQREDEEFEKIAREEDKK